MSLEELALLAEIIGGLGVIASLIYLALQIRQNTRTVAANTFQAISTASSNMGMQAIQTPGLTAVLTKAHTNYSELDTEEKMLLEVFLGSMLRNYENYYYQYRRGFLEEELWIGYRTTLLQFIGAEYGREIWRRHQIRYGSAFVEFVNTELSQGEIKSVWPAAMNRRANDL